MGTATVQAQFAADLLGLPVQNVAVRLRRLGIFQRHARGRVVSECFHHRGRYGSQ